jgi:hypothetical protein
MQLRKPCDKRAWARERFKEAQKVERATEQPHGVPVRQTERLHQEGTQLLWFLTGPASIS